MRFSNSFAVILLWTSALGSTGTAFIVVPDGLRYQEGNSFTLWPFLIQQVSSAVPSIRYQQVYDASAFSQIEPRGAFLTRLFMRASTNTSFGAMGVSTNVQISFSTTLKAPDSLNTVFSENVGKDQTVVFGPGPLKIGFLSAGFSTGVDGGEFPLTNAFWYNPAAGNLLLDVRIYPGEPPYPNWSVPSWLDAQDTPGDSVSSIFSLSVDAAAATYTN